MVFLLTLTAQDRQTWIVQPYVNVDHFIKTRLQGKNTMMWQAAHPALPKWSKVYRGLHIYIYIKKYITLNNSRAQKSTTKNI